MHKVGRVRAYLILAIALMIKVTILGHFRILGSEPDIVLICVTFFGLFFGSGAGLEAGIVAGLMTDVYSLDYFGINTFVYSVVGVLAGAMNTSFAKESKRAQAFLVFLCAVFLMSLRFFIVSTFSSSMTLRFPEYFRVCIIPSGAYTAAVSIPVFLKFIDMYRLREQEDLL